MLGAKWPTYYTVGRNEAPNGVPAPISRLLGLWVSPMDRESVGMGGQCHPPPAARLKPQSKGADGHGSESATLPRRRGNCAFQTTTKSATAMTDFDDWDKPTPIQTKSIADVLKDGSKRDYLNDEFKRLAERGRKAEEAVACYLERCGFEVRLPEKKIRDNIEDRKQFSDEGDLFYKKNDIWYQVEVKSHDYRTKPFTCIADFPFKDVLLAREHRMNFRRTYKWVMVSSDFRYGAVTPLESVIYWYKDTRTKKNYGTTETDWYVPVSHTKIVKLI